MSTGTTKLDVTVSDVVPVNDLVKRFHFRPTAGGLLPTFSGGAHVVVEMRDGDTARLNPYSLMSSPLDTQEYTISIRRDDVGRGGSLFMHGKVKPGHRMVISYPVNLFSLDLRAKKHLMLAGGIGITPFLAQTAQLAADGGNFELHYSVRTASLNTYADRLQSHYGRRVSIYHDDRDERIPLDRLLASQPLGTHLYICGPAGMINWARARAAALGWPDETVHFEHFAAPQARPALRRHARRQRQADPRRRAAEPARSHRGGRRRSALSLPRRRLRPVRDISDFLRRQVPAQRPLALRRGAPVGQEDHALRVALRGPLPRP